MKTQTIIVLRHPNGAYFFDGEIRTQTFGDDFVAGVFLRRAKTYASREAAQADKEAHAKHLGRHEIVELNLWLPQPGEPVVYVCRSNISGAFANVRIGVVKKVTQRGYVHLDRVTESFFRHDETTFFQTGRSNFRTSIRPASADDLSVLPPFNDIGRAQAVARAWNENARKEREAAHAGG